MTRSLAQDATGYARFFDLSGEMMATMDLVGQFTTVNESFQKALGYTSAELLAGPAVDFVHVDDQPASTTAFAELLAGRQITGFTNRCRGSDGSYRLLEWSATPDVDDDRIYASALDITDARAKDEALTRLVSDLERSNEELSQFAYVASHDLSEPLRVVAGHVELLASRYRGRLDDDADRYIAFAVDGCGRMRSLIDDLLAFSRAGREEGGVDDVDLRPIVDEAIAALADRIALSGATITVGPMPVVVGSHVQLTRVLANLIENALKFRRPDHAPTIAVTAERREDGWQVSVEDDGIGIEPQYQERIFRIFQRLHGGDAYPGTGIGLAICRKMVELRGGQIWCEGREGPGARLCFSVPDQVVSLA